MKTFKATVTCSSEAAATIAAELFKSQQYEHEGATFGFFRKENAAAFATALLDRGVDPVEIDSDDLAIARKIEAARGADAAAEAGTAASGDEATEAGAQAGNEAPEGQPKAQGAAKVRDLQLGQRFKYKSSKATWTVTGTNPLKMIKDGATREWPVTKDKELDQEVTLI